MNSNFVSPEMSHCPDHHDQITTQIADENFVFRKVHFSDHEVTGAQIAEAANAYPVEEFIVLQWLKTHELESLRPTETAVLADSDGFFVIKGSETFRFYTNGRSMEWPRDVISGDKIKRLAGYQYPVDVELLLEQEKTPDEIIEDDQDVTLNAPGVERFKIHPLPLVIEVNAVEYHPSKPEMTPNEIIIAVENFDPAKNYLIQIFPTKENYKDKTDVPITLHRGMRFCVISLGPTPVSDPNQASRGVGAFEKELRTMGFTPIRLPNNSNCIVFDYTVECGKFSGTKVRIGLKVPDDFPATPPTGPCISPEIHPICSGGTHPLGGIHKGNWVVPFEAEAGGKWQYWSRPYTEWRSGIGSVHAYMAHVAKLWVTQ